MVVEFLAGNRITLLNSGNEYFPALLSAIESAQVEIYLESYIFANDAIGHEVAGALSRAAARGVQVNVTVDGFGARNFRADFLPRLTVAGVRAMFYRPEIGPFHLRRHRLRRLHRKLVVIDAHVAFVGGINIIDDNNAPEEMRPRYDYAVRIEGPTLRQVHHAVRRMWEIVSWVNFKRRFRHTVPVTPSCEIAGEQDATLLIRDNIRHRNDILHAYITAINAAQNEILIANAYFLPGLRFEKSFMHAKVAVVDRLWATVGSSNIDPFSLLLAKEANLFVRNPAFAAELHASVRHAIASGAREMLADELTAHPWHIRALRWLSYELVRMLVGLTGWTTSSAAWSTWSAGARVCLDSFSPAALTATGRWA